MARPNISGHSAGNILMKQFGVSDMPDERRADSPKPVLHTTVTMLTAIGLCVLIMVMRLLRIFVIPVPASAISATAAAR